MNRAPTGGPMPEGMVMSGSFVLDGVEFLALRGGPLFKFTDVRRSEVVLHRAHLNLV